MKEIHLTQGKVTLVDDEDFEWLSQWKWCIANKYAVRGYKENGKYHSVRMHRLILDAPNGIEVDHIDGNTLNNQRSNIRLATSSQNGMNKQESGRKNKTSKFKGVSFNTARHTYVMSISFARKTTKKHFPTEIEAAREYDRLALIYHGEFARLNFP